MFGKYLLKKFFSTATSRELTLCTFKRLENNIGLIELNNPGKKNALSKTLLEDLL
jgi:enoyl-CoA hydratase/carnithine racemase